MKCKVCEIDNASNYNHYGSAQVCYSCRGFFMRSVKSSMFKVFKHNEKTGCIIDSKNRKSCKKCRFNKCLDAGMKVGFVCMQSLSPKKELLLENILTMDEECQMVQLYHAASDACNDRLYDILESDMTLAYLMFDEPPNSLQMTDQYMDAINRLDKFGYLTMFQTCGKATQMDETILHILAEHNYGKINSCLSFIWFGRGFNTENTMRFMEYGKHSRKSSEKMDTIIKLMEQQSKRSSKQDLYKYEVIYDSPWAANASIEEEHKSIADKIRQWYEESRKPTEDIDNCLLILLMQILLYNTNGLQLPKAYSMQVEKCQQNCANLLLKYLKSHLTMQASYKQLHTGLMIVSDSQRAYELSQQRLQLDMTDAEENLDLLSLMDENI